MVEDSCGFEISGIDTRNLQNRKFDSKKRLNHKEEIHRLKQVEKRDKQRNGLLGNSEELKEEFDEINLRYQKQLEDKKKAEEKAAKKRENFEKDLIEIAIGPEPKDASTRKKQNYENKLEKYKEPENKQKPICGPQQRAKFLAFLQNSIK